MKSVILACLGLIVGLAVACSGDVKPVLLTQAPSPTPGPQLLTPTPAVEIPSYSISGVILSGSNSLLLGGQITFEPGGFSGTADFTDAFFHVPNVPDGEYTVKIVPRCVVHGCYLDPILVVDGRDVPEFNLAPTPASFLPGGPVVVRSLSMPDGAMLKLDQVEFAADNLILTGPNDMQPGESAQMVLAGPQCLRCAPLLAIDAPVVWSVTPPVGVHVDVESGLVTVNSGAPIGSTYTLTADVGEFTVTKEIIIYSAGANPLVGVWTESGTGNIRQLLFTSTGEFAVTVNPYEHYQDYWGNYIFDTFTTSIQLTATGANQTAPDGQGTGTFTIDESGRLTLEGICLGGWDVSTQLLEMNCDHEFER